MSVEGGPSGAIGAGVAGPVMAGGLPGIVNEGPVRSLEGFRPMNASDITTIDKGGTIAPEVAAKAWEAPELNAADAVSEAQSIIAQAQKHALGQPEATIVPNVIPAWIPDHLAQPQPVVVPQIVPQVEPAPILQVSPALEPARKTRVFNQVAHAIAPQPLLQEQEVEELVEEKVRVEDSTDSLEEEEEIENIKRKFVVDERALSQVVIELKVAARKAGVLAAKLGIKITGELISKFLPGQHQGNESEAVKGKGPDGSIPERQQSIEELGEFSSGVQAEEKVVKVAYEKPPIKIRSEGEPVKPEDVRRVFNDHVAKPAAVAYEIVTKRIVKKKVQVLAGPIAVESKTVETSLEELSPELAEVFEAEVFQKAA